ncbi:Uncharacterized protein TCAP_06253 [Tolypocladium capitatum]|uniref:Uncharacterized protein n=1 Tax=Tolypocladium capitatum TaxID=45235 RepID=A0A2K3Q8B6_9HYPO|nr:Uncharacterized protein TCAP_06253 [Tolypocladium capitatum]
MEAQSSHRWTLPTCKARAYLRRLNRSSDEEYRYIPLTPESPTARDAFVTIPTVRISSETLIYVGLSEARAAELWSRWTNWPDSGPSRETDADDEGLQVEFIDFITGTLSNRVNTAEDDDNQWRACLNAYGIAVDVQDAILDPHFKYLRLSESCLFWAKDTIEMRYAGLEDIQRASRKREMELYRAASRPGGDDSEYAADRHQGRLPLGRGLSMPTGQGQRSVSGLQQQNTSGIEAESWGSVSGIAARNAPGHVVLFKGIDQGRITGLFDEAGALDIGTLLSSAPSDFSGTRSLFYFTLDYEVAEYYAAFAKRRAECESVVIVCLRIPNTALESLSAPEIQRIYWPSSEWKELVWRCRTNEPIPLRLRKYRQAVLTIGSISRKPNYTYRTIRSFEEVTERSLLEVRRSGRNVPAIQYVFSGQEEGREFLVEHGVRDLKVFPFPQSELEAWLASDRWTLFIRFLVRDNKVTGLSALGRWST